MKHKPMPHQLRVAEMATQLPRVAVFDPPGCGKTLSGMLALRSFGSEDDRCLIVCEANKIFDWETECKLHGRDIRVISYDRFRIWVMKARHDTARYTAFIFDEAHALKNPEAARTKAARVVLSSRGVKAVFLTGTPFTKNIIDTFEMMRTMLGPNTGMSREFFETNFCEFITKPMMVYSKKWKKNLKIQVREFLRAKNLPVFKKHFGKWVLRRTKEQVYGKSNIPSATICPHYIRFARKEKQSLMAYANQDDVNPSKIRQQLSAMKAKDFATYICNHMDSYPDDLPVLIACKHLSIVDMYTNHLVDKGHECAIITGETPPESRTQIIQDAAAGRWSAIIFTITTAGTGLNLQFANNIFMAETDISLGQFIQTTHRVIRIGQTKHCNVHVAIANLYDKERVARLETRMTEHREVL